MQEFKQAIISLPGLGGLTGPQLDELIARLDLDCSGDIAWHEFVSYVAFDSEEVRQAALLLRQQIVSRFYQGRDFKSVFDQMLVEMRKGEGGSGWFAAKDRKGDPDKLDVEDMRAAMRKLCGLTLSDGEGKALLALLDADSNGYVTVQEFADFLQAQAEDIASGGADADAAVADVAPIVDIQIELESATERC